MTEAAPSPPEVVLSEIEQPLPKGQHGLFLLYATLLIGLFYFLSGIALVLGALLLIVAIVIAIGAARYGGLHYIRPVVLEMVALLTIVLRSMRIRGGAEFMVQLPREQAPVLWEHVEELARRVDVAPPQQIVLESGVNAWVRLRGVASGRGKTTLGVGYDMLAGLAAEQLRAVLAHEMAHAKYVRRGYQGFLMRGLIRLGQCAESLKQLSENPEFSGAGQAAGGWVYGLLDKIGGKAGKLVAVCSRYDEFLADATAAEICGPEVCRRALLETHVLDFQADKIYWRERLLHLERAPGYTAWLYEQLQVPDEARRAELEKRALERAHRHELSTHPALPDRLAALDKVFTGEVLPMSSGGKSGAWFWLKEPDVTARHLLTEFERIAAAEEAKQTASLAKWMRKNAGGRQQAGSTPRAGHWLGLVGASLMVFICLAEYIKQPHPVFICVGLVAVLLDGWCFYQLFGSQRMAREVDLPLPGFAEFRAALFARRDKQRRERELYFAHKELDPDEKAKLEVEAEERESLEQVAKARELRGAMPVEIAKPRARLAYWLGETMTSLAVADYATAELQARLALEQEYNHLTAMAVLNLCLAYQSEEEAFNRIRSLFSTRRDFQAQWAIAWAAYLTGQTGYAEAHLLELTRMQPGHSVLWSLLGYCQTANDKPREGLASQKRALELALKSGNAADEACCRFALAQSQDSLGQLMEARGHLDWIEEYQRREPLIGIDEAQLALENIRWFTARGEVDEVARRAEAFTAQWIETVLLEQLGHVIGNSGEEALRDIAETYFQRVLERGFYPEVMVALSRLAYHREDKAECRRLVLNSLDTTRPRPHDADHPLPHLREVLNALRAVDDLPPQPVKAWEAHLRMPESTLKVQKLSLLCCFADVEAARRAADIIFEALLPDVEWSGQREMTLAEQDIQPDKPMPPGIYGCQWEA